MQNKGETAQQTVKLSEEIVIVRSELIKEKGECTSRLGERFEQLYQEVERVKSISKRQFDLVNSEICRRFYSCLRREHVATGWHH
jgi:hypothetical protein